MVAQVKVLIFLNQSSIIVMQFLNNQIDLKGLELVGKHYFCSFFPFV